MKKESKFKVGDRVAVYGYLRTPNRSTVLGYMRGDYGTITRINNPEDEVLVRTDDEKVECEAHPKQLRRLVKKERRRILLHVSSIPGRFFSFMGATVYGEGEKISSDSYVEFVEVRRKK
jgi:hypothetical protein